MGGFCVGEVELMLVMKKAVLFVLSILGVLSGYAQNEIDSL